MNEEIKMDEKAQGALEYLLIIAGAVVVAAIVVSFMADILPKLFCQAETELHQFNQLTHA